MNTLIKYWNHQGNYNTQTIGWFLLDGNIALFWIFRNFYISSLLEKRIVPSKYWKMKWLETVVSLIFFWGMGGVGVSLFVHSKKFIILRICRFVKFFSTNNIMNFILQLTFLSLQDSDLSTVNYLRMGEICNTSLWTCENIQNI